ncbi:glucose-6-phosphate dehydrogenase [Kineococcus terrestris]|uniref:glucose-6-phosphate dehydrogenase n=1 Tax=Kineococcus terrestris TaxID=2044856 RepID=UPI0034DB2945
MTAQFVLLGATGDLTRRYLLPALAQIADDVAGGVRVVGVAQDDLDTAGFRERLAEPVPGRLPQGAPASLTATAEYLRGDVTDPADLSRALELATAGRGADAGDDPVVVYLALPHVLFEPVVEALAEVELPAATRVVVEKPFGQDGEGARRLNAALARVVPEERTFRVDHFLAKQTVLNVLGLRFANRFFEAVWNSTHVAGVDIVFDESVDAQARANYYDRSGALRDMVQNHLLQLLTYVAMEPPQSMRPAELSARKVDVLRAVRPLDDEAVRTSTVRARYTAGTVDGEHVDAYVDAPGVDPARGTETYAEVVLHVDTWRWSGVPFRLRTGKALGADRREVVVRFRDVPHAVFAGPRPPANELRLQLDPDRLSLRVQLNGSGDPFDLESAELDTELARQDPGPYGQLLLAVVAGDTRLSAHAAEAEEGWRIVEPVLAAWERGEVPLREYPAGSDGPA